VSGWFHGGAGWGSAFGDSLMEREARCSTAGRRQNHQNGLANRPYTRPFVAGGERLEKGRASDSAKMNQGSTVGIAIQHKDSLQETFRGNLHVRITHTDAGRRKGTKIAMSWEWKRGVTSF